MILPRHLTASFGTAKSSEGAFDFHRCIAAHSLLCMLQSLFWQVYDKRLSNELRQPVTDLTYRIAIPELLTPGASLQPRT